MIQTILTVIFMFVAFIAFSAERDCSSLQEYRLLDFWIGDWDVFVGNQKVGTNKIEPILNSCAVIENWKDATGAEGKSFFYFALADKVWKQVCYGSGLYERKDTAEITRERRSYIPGASSKS